MATETADEKYQREMREYDQANGQPGTDLAVQPVMGTQLDVLPPVVLQMLMAVRSEIPDNPEQIQLAIVTAILEAENPEDMFSLNDVTHAQDCLGMPFLAESVSWGKSEHVSGLRVFALVHGRWLADDKKCIISCGGTSALAMLYKMQSAGWFPMPLKIAKKAKPTRQGFYPIWLEPAEIPLTQS